MAWDDQRHGIARHRDADILRGLRCIGADALRELAIGHGFAECDLAQCVVDRAAERLNTGQVEPDRVEIDPLACEVLPRLIDDCRNMRRRFGWRCAAEAVRRAFLRSRKVEARHASLVPRDGGKAELRFEHVIVDAHRKSRGVSSYLRRARNSTTRFQFASPSAELSPRHRNESGLIS